MQKTASKVSKGVLCTLCTLFCTFASSNTTIDMFYIIIYLCYFSAFLFLFGRKELRLNLFLVNAYLMNIMALRMIVTCLIALFTNTHLSDVAYTNSVLSETSIIITICALIIVMLIMLRFVPGPMVHRITQVKDLRQGMNLWMIMSDLYLLIQSSNYASNTNTGFILFKNLLAVCVLLLFANWAFLFYNIRIIKLLDFEYENHKMHVIRDALTSESSYSFEADITANQILSVKCRYPAVYLKENIAYTACIKNITENLICSEDADKFQRLTAPDELYIAFTQGNRRLDADFRMCDFTGIHNWYRGSIVLTQDELTGHCLIFFYASNIQREMNEKENLNRAATTDGLTGLSNKITAIHAIRQSVIDGGVIFVIDIDNFKEINDTLGHSNGDLILQKIALKLRHIFHDCDVLGRFGGDEFIVFFQNGALSPASSARRADDACAQCRDTLQTENGQTLISTISIGGFIVPHGHSYSFEKAFEMADKALYDAKHKGRDTYSIFS